jgi:hypothetical protein
MTDLLKQEVQVQGNVDVKMVERPQNGPDLESDPAARKQACSLTTTKMGFSGKISQLENTVFIFIYKWNASGDIVYQEKISVPVGEDAEALVARLAKCLVNNEKFEKTATANTVMIKDSKQQRRMNGAISGVCRVGMLYPYKNHFQVAKITSDYSSSSYTLDYINGNAFAMDGGIAYDINSWVFEATMGFNGSRDFHFSIGGEYLFLDGLFSPYIGANIGVALVNKASSDYYNGSTVEDSLEKNSDGIFSSARVGLLLFRNHNVRFIAPEVELVGVANDYKDWGIRATVGMMISF